MTSFNQLTKIIACLALAMMIFGQPISLIAATPMIANEPAIDVALRGQNELHGQVVDKNGLPTSGVVVVFEDGQKSSAVETITDEQGRFAFASVPAGASLIQVGDTSTSVRTWAVNTAPPSAQQAVVISTSPTVRGQAGAGCLTRRGVAALAIWGVAVGIGIYEGVKVKATN
jgi:hypothetical protein